MEQISRQFAVEEVRKMAYQFADLYFAFVAELRGRLGDEETRRIAEQVLFTRAKERAEAMIARAEKEGLPRVPENITKTSDVPYLGWDKSLGCEHCPYGAAWNKRIAAHPWFRPYARLYCDVTDTTIAEIFTGSYSHKLIKNVVLGDADCERVYFPSEAVGRGVTTYGADE